MRKSIITVTSILALLSPAAADECVPNSIGFDVCEYAQGVQRTIAPTLPMQMSREMTLNQISAVGPIISAVVLWNYDQQGIDDLTAAHGITREQFVQRMEQFARQMVCGDETLEAFVGLGGHIQYVYRTRDGHVVHSPTISDC